MRDDEHLQNIPSITPAVDEVASHRHKHRKAAKEGTASRSKAGVDAGVARTSGAQKFIISLLWILVLGLGFVLFVVYEQAKVATDLLSDARLRVQKLESRLSVTDENFTQSGAALQVTLKEQQKSIKLWESEIRKLWDVTNKRNKNDITKNKALIAKQKKTTVSHSSALKQNSQSLKQNSQSLKVIKEQLIALGGAVQKLDKALEGQDFTKFDNQLRILDQRFKNLVNQVDDVEHTLESFDAYRLQVNQSISSLESALNSVQKSLLDRAPAASSVGQ